MYLIRAAADRESMGQKGVRYPSSLSPLSGEALWKEALILVCSCVCVGCSREEGDGAQERNEKVPVARGAGWHPPAPPAKHHHHAMVAREKKDDNRAGGGEHVFFLIWYLLEKELPFSTGGVCLSFPDLTLHYQRRSQLILPHLPVHFEQPPPLELAQSLATHVTKSLGGREHKT